MASPTQQQSAQPLQYVQQQQARQPGPIIQQPQYIQQTQVLHSHGAQGCCNPIGRFLPLPFRPTQFALGICMILNGFASVIFGVVGIFTAYFISHGSNNHIYIYRNPAALIGADIWAGVFVSFDSTTVG